MRFRGEHFRMASLCGEEAREIQRQMARPNFWGIIGGHDLLVKLSDENGGGEGCNGCDYVGYFPRGL